MGKFYSSGQKEGAAAPIGHTGKMSRLQGGGAREKWLEIFLLGKRSPIIKGRGKGREGRLWRKGKRDAL